MISTIDNVTTRSRLKGTAVPMTPDDAGREFYDRTPTLIYVTNNHGHSEHEIGSVVLVGRYSGHHWSTLDTNLMLEGAPVNPPLVNGAYYRGLGDEEDDPRQVLVQYFDDDHSDERFNSSRPFNLLEMADGNTWPVPNDSVHDLELFTGQYVQVEAPSTPDPETIPAAENDERSSEPEDDRPNPAGLGEAEFKPELVEGSRYVLWRDSNLTPGRIERSFYVATYVGENSFLVDHKLSLSYDGESYIGTTDDTAAGILVIEDGGFDNWRKLRTGDPVPAAEDSENRATVAMNRATALATKWDEFEEALCDMAQNQSWCSEFEDVVRPLGMQGRNRKYRITVEATFTWTLSNPSSNVDRAVSSDLGIDVELSEVSGEGTKSVYLYREGRNGDDASESIDSDDVERELTSELSGSVTVDVTDWSIDETEEDDD